MTSFIVIKEHILLNFVKFNYIIKRTRQKYKIVDILKHIIEDVDVN